MDYEYLLDEQAYLSSMLDQIDDQEELELTLKQLDRIEYELNLMQGASL